MKGELCISAQQCLRLPRFLLAFVVVGCGGSSEQPAFEKGQISVITTDTSHGAKAESSKTEVVIVAPVPQQKLSLGETIDCIVRVTVPDGGRAPAFVNVDIRQNDRIFSSCTPIPEKKLEAGRYEYKGSMKSPSKPGRYEMRAQAIDTTIIRDEKGNDVGDPQVSKYLSTRVPIDFVVPSTSK